MIIRRYDDVTRCLWFMFSVQRPRSISDLERANGKHKFYDQFVDVCIRKRAFVIGGNGETDSK